MPTTPYRRDMIDGMGTILATATQNDPLITRAFAAYFRARKDAWSPDQPASSSYLCEHEGREYVVLHNVNGVLAVYRVRNNGLLRELKRWPKEIEEY